MARFSANFAFVTETNVVSVQQAQNVVAAQQRAAGWILYLRWFRNGCLSLGFVRRKCDEKDNFWFGLLPNSARQAGSCTFAGFVRQGSPTLVDAVCPDDARCSRGLCPGKIPPMSPSTPGPWRKRRPMRTRLDRHRPFYLSTLTAACKHVTQGK